MSAYFQFFFFFSLSLPLYFRCNNGFDILQGYVQGLSDTWTFLTSLAKLDTVHYSENSMEKKSMREHKAAGGLIFVYICFWEVAYICLYLWASIGLQLGGSLYLFFLDFFL